MQLSAANPWVAFYCVCDRRLSLSGEGTVFEQQASSAVLDLMGDEGDRLNQHKNIMKW